MAAPRVAEPREGYELVRPNREKPQSQRTKAIVVFLLVATVALILIITIGGLKRLEGGPIGPILYALIYIVAAIVVARWNRGILPVIAALSTILIIFLALAAPAWFARDKDGLDSPLLNESVLGLLTALMIPLQVLVIVVGLYAFNQNWHVEEERKISGHPAHRDEEPGGPGRAEPATA